MTETEKRARFREHYLGWDIYVVPEAYLQKPSGALLSLYVAVDPSTHRIITGIDLPDIEADIEEAER